MTEQELSKADKRKLKELRAEYRAVPRTGWIATATWYGAPGDQIQQAIRDERARITAQADAIKNPAPVLTGVIVEAPTLF